MQEQQTVPQRPTMAIVNPIIRLHEADNVVVARATLLPGTPVGDGINATQRVPPGHKAAVRRIEDGESARKYNQITGFATQAIAPGEHVHVQNMGMGDFAKDYAYGVDAKPTDYVPEPATFEGIVTSRRALRHHGLRTQAPARSPRQHRMNSGGAHCLKYGVTQQPARRPLVLLDGTVVEIGGKHLDSPGYDLLGLVCGSEGQLGVVTEATVRILRAAEGARPALMGFDSAETAGACVAAIIGAGIIPVAMEYMDRALIEISEAFAHAGYPLDVEAMLIIEVEGSEAEIEDMLSRIVEIAKPFSPKTLKVAQSEAEAAAIWKGRKAIGGALGRVSDFIVMDGTIPTGQLPFVLRRIHEICHGYGLKVATVLHAGDGNLHPNIMFDINKPGELEKAEAAGEDILKLCVEVGGCLTGEHGVGIEKRDLMRVQFAPEDLQQQMRVRAVFDPAWLLNPAKVFPLDGRYHPD